MDLKELKEQIAELIAKEGYELVSLSFANDVLNVVVDREQDIDMNAIVEITNVINAYLDETNPFEKAYTLDVSSLGAEKPLSIEKLSAYQNRFVHVHLINPIKGENIYEGDLTSVNETSIVVTYKNKTRSIPVEINKNNISKIRLAIKF